MSWPPVNQLVPHRGPMCLLDRIVRHDAEQTVCALRVGDSQLFADAEGQVPGYVCLEWMAQCIAVRGGLLAREAGLPPRPGLFLGSRRATLPPGSFGPEQGLEVDARLLRGRGVGAHAFACTLREPGAAVPLAEGTLNVMIFESLEALTAPTSGGAWR